MQSYLQTMDLFLETQEQVMHSFMARARAAAPPTQHPMQLADLPRETMDAETQPLPFVGKIISFIPSQEVVTHRTINLSEDLFLHDHTFGGQVSAIDDTLEPLPVIPMTVAMEIMAETAALLVPGKWLIGMRTIQTYQWIDVEGEQTTLRISARRRAADQHEVEVRVHNLGENGEGSSRNGALAMQGIAVFGDAYPEAPRVEPLSLTSPKPPEFTAAELYKEHLMFHGPRFHGVVSLDAIAKEGLLGQLQSLPTNGLFRSTSRPRLLTDFALLDAAGQLVGYWPLERVETGYNMFPIRVDALHIYEPFPAEREKVVCQVQMREVHEKYMRADVDIILPGDRLWMRLEGWCDWRFYGPAAGYDFFRFPGETAVSKSMPAPISRFPTLDEFECCSPDLGETFASREASAFWIKVWARLILSHQERREFSNLEGPAHRREEWLLARIAAKDAIRLLLKRLHGISLYPADIEITEDENGRPAPQGYWVQKIGYVPALSVSHSGQLAIGIAGRCAAHQRLGVDVQRMEPRSQDFEAIAFAPQERSLLDSIENSARQEWLTRFWCAKEALGKALGRGLIHGPQSVVVQAWDEASGVVQVALGEGLAGEFPELAGVFIAVYTTCRGDFIIASTLCERV
jgi:phosphopantetheinyl transferase